MTDLYLNSIYEWEGDDTQPYPGLVTYKTGRVLLPYKKTFYAARLITGPSDRQDYYEAIESRKRLIRRNNRRISAGVIWDPIVGFDIELNGDDLEDVPTVADYSGDFESRVDIYGDGTLLFSKEVYAADVPFKIKGGVRARSWEFLISCNVRIRNFAIADSMEELTAPTQAGG